MFCGEGGHREFVCGGRSPHQRSYAPGGNVLPCSWHRDDIIGSRNMTSRVDDWNDMKAFQKKLLFSFNLISALSHILVWDEVLFNVCHLFQLFRNKDD